MIGSSTTTEGPTERPGRDTMRIALVSLFPEMFAAVGDYGVVVRAVRQGQVHLSVCNPRDYTVDAHRTVDDRPYGGGPGMLMKVEPLKAAIDAARLEANARSVLDRPCVGLQSRCINSSF